MLSSWTQPFKSLKSSEEYFSNFSFNTQDNFIHFSKTSWNIHCMIEVIFLPANARYFSLLHVSEGFLIKSHCGCRFERSFCAIYMAWHRRKISGTKNFHQSTEHITKHLIYKSFYFMPSPNYIAVLLILTLFIKILSTYHSSFYGRHWSVSTLYRARKT